MVGSGVNVANAVEHTEVTATTLEVLKSRQDPTAPQEARRSAAENKGPASLGMIVLRFSLSGSNAKCRRCVGAATALITT